MLGTEPGPALLWAASFALPTLVLLPATVAMGGTLAALERMVSEARGDMRVSAGVYGANTAGAVAGTFTIADGSAMAIGLWPTPQKETYYTYYGVELVNVRIQPAT